MIFEKIIVNCKRTGRKEQPQTLARHSQMRCLSPSSLGDHLLKEATCVLCGDTRAFLIQGARHDAGTMRTTVVYEGAEVHARPGAPGHLQPEHHPARLHQGAAEMLRAARGVCVPVGGGLSATQDRAQLRRRVLPQGAAFWVPCQFVCFHGSQNKRSSALFHIQFIVMKNFYECILDAEDRNV